MVVMQKLRNTLDLFAKCKKIEPYVDYCRKQIRFYNDTAHHVLKNEIDLVFPYIPAKQKSGIITTLVPGFIGLAYEGISSFLNNRKCKALQKAFKVMNSKTTIKHNELMHLEDSAVMYSIYNAEILEQLINTVHCIHNTTTSNEKLFVRQHSTTVLQSLYANVQGIQHYSINSLLYLRTVKDKYLYKL